MTDCFLEFYPLVRFCDIEDQGKKDTDPGIASSVSLRDCIFLWLHV